MKKLLFSLLLLCIIISSGQAMRVSTESLDNARSIIQALEARGYMVSRMEAVHQNIVDAYNSGNIEEAQLLYDQLDSMLSNAAMLADSLDSSEAVLGLLKGKGYDVAEASLLWNKALFEYNLNNFDASGKSLEGAGMKIGAYAGDYLENSLGQLGAIFNGDLSPPEAALYNISVSSMERLYDSGNYTLLLSYDVGLINTTLLEYRETRAKLSGPGQVFAGERLKGYLDQQDFYLSSGELGQAGEMSAKIDSLLESHSAYQKEIKEAEAKMQELSLIGISPKGASDILSEAKLEAGYENYEKAGELAKEAGKLLDKAQQDNLVQAALAKAAKNISPLEFIRDNWPIILIVILTLFFGYRLGIRRFRVVLAQKKHLALLKEKESINKLLVRLQMSYYKEYSIDEETYKSQRELYEKRLDEIDQEMPVLKDLLDKLQPGKAKTFKAKISNRDTGLPHADEEQVPGIGLPGKGKPKPEAGVKQGG